jgi:hypothetical protein
MSWGASGFWFLTASGFLIAQKPTRKSDENLKQTLSNLIASLNFCLSTRASRVQTQVKFLARWITLTRHRLVVQPLLQPLAMLPSSGLLLLRHPPLRPHPPPVGRAPCGFTAPRAPSTIWFGPPLDNPVPLTQSATANANPMMWLCPCRPPIHWLRHWDTAHSPSCVTSCQERFPFLQTVQALF